MARSQHETGTQRGSRRKSREQSQSAKPRRGNGKTGAREMASEDDDRERGYQADDRYPGSTSEPGRRMAGYDSDIEGSGRERWDTRRDREAGGEWRPGQRDPSEEYGRYGGEGYAEEQFGDERYSGSRGRDYREGYEDRYGTNRRGRDYRGGMGQQGGMSREGGRGMSLGGGQQSGMGSYGPDEGGIGWGSGQALGGIGWGPRTGGRGFTGRGPKNWKRSDDRIEDDLNARLTSHPDVDASEIEVSVKDGEVTLSGTVSDQESKRCAEDVAEMISGVSNVQNNLRVESQSQGQREPRSAGSARAMEKESKRSRSSELESSGKQQQRH